MHDIKFIRQNPDAFDAALARRGLKPHASLILELDAQKRKNQTELQDMLAKRNTFAKAIGQAKAKGEDATAIMEESKRHNEATAAMEASLNEHGALESLLETLPNLPAEDVPEGTDEHGNKELRVVGTKPTFTFTPKEHDALGEGLKLMDFDGAAKLSGARFVVLKGALARMERALANFMLDIHTTQFGYTEHVPPALVRSSAMYGTGQLPKFEADLFRTASVDYDALLQYLNKKDTHPEGGIFSHFWDLIKLKELSEKGNSFYLIPTAEVPLTNLVSDTIIEEESLPIRMTAYTQCFRSEAGAAGKDTRGMIRQHQFSKVELVTIAHPDHAKAEHERMTSAAEEILKRLGLHYRVMALCTGDMG
ncbi:MAG: serine--tRNA ligase, partial [Rickettsiales bacterium]|nr:serine--tRNA ligase [Rickettsiales bacterium]